MHREGQRFLGNDINLILLIADHVLLNALVGALEQLDYKSAAGAGLESSTSKSAAGAGLESSTSKSWAGAGLGSIRGVFTHHRKWPLRRGATVACVSIVNVSYVTSYARYGTLLSR